MRLDFIQEPVRDLEMISQRLILSLVYLIFCTVLGSVRGSLEQNGCSSSCGVQSIRYPFRIRGDPVSCGKPQYELICDGNKTILQLNPGKYYVTRICYENSTLQIVDANIASGPCRLPYQFPSLEYRGINNYMVISPKSNYQIFLPMISSGRASFLNCSTEVRDRKYNLIPCMSGESTFVYSSNVVYEVEDIMPSCSLISEVPIDIDSDMITLKTDILQLLLKGYNVKWGLRRSRFQWFRPCLREISSNIADDNRESTTSKWLLYPFQYGSKFLGCLYTTDNQYVDTESVPLVLVVLLDIAIALTVIAILVRFIFLPLCIYVFLAYEYWKIMVPVDSIEKFLRSQQTLSPTRYAYTDIIVMTKNFREKLGQGGFGSVFKGELPGGHWVAVKMLGNYKCNGDDFINEVSTIGRIHHVNVVRLVGFCSDGSKSALIYEFMPHGSLDKYIFSSSVKERQFIMDKLNEIALGVARGINYLHRGCDMRIIHFDIKPQNILLDQNFNPKVADFGLAKLCPRDHSLVSMSAAVGTIGYMAPELISRSFGVVSDKSDVYSFGMLLLEMAGGRRNVDNNAQSSSQVYYPSWIYDKLQQSELPEISNTLKIGDMERKFCKVGLWCIQMRPTDRPSISRVIEMLEAEDDTLPIPPKPFSSALQPVSLQQTPTDSSRTELSIISEVE